MKQLAGVILTLVIQAIATAQVIPFDNYWLTDGTVLCSQLAGDTLYIGGSFTHVGPQNYNGAIINATTGMPLKTDMHPDDVVRSVVADGTGGWIIGGEFQVMGRNNFRSGLARLNADGSLHAWQPSLNGTVQKLIRVQDTLYVAGTFDTVNEVPRNKLAAFKISTGELLAWNPAPNSDVFALTYYNGEVLAGGNFTEIGGQPRTALAALHYATGAATVWNPVLVQPFTTAQVYNLHIIHGILYVAGFFETINNAERKRLAAIDMNTLTLTPWKPEPNGNVETILAEDSKLFVGGSFAEIGGKFRLGLARLNTTDGQADEWEPPSGLTSVKVLLMSQNRLLIGGEFDVVAGDVRNSLVALNPQAGAVLPWNPNPSKSFITDIVPQGDNLFIAGSYQGIGGKNRTGLAALKLPEGFATDFDAEIPEGTIWSLAYENDTLYAGGVFQQSKGELRSRLAAFKHSSGQLMPWNPGANGVVYALATQGAHVYAGGEFSFAGDANRNNLAQLSKTNGNATAWNPQPNGEVRALTTSLEHVYVGGRYFEIGGQTRWCLATLPHTGTGIPTAWEPNINPDGTVLSLLRTHDRLYVGGTYQQMNGQPRTSISLFDLPGHTLNETFKPNFNGSIRAMTLQENTLYAGGEFTSNFNFGNKDLVALNASAGTFLPWNPSGPLSVFALQQRPESILTGGRFFSIASRRVNNFAALPPDLTLPLRSLAVQAHLRQKQVEVIWQVNEEDDVQHYKVERSTNGQSFAQIGTQWPNGNNRHQYFDEIIAEKQYYRVKALLKDGRIFTSNTVVVSKLPVGAGKVFPNPGKGNYLYYQNGSLPEGLHQISLVNALGQTLAVTKVQGGENQVIAIPVQNLAGGLYVLVVSDINGKRIDVINWLKP